MLRVAGCLDEPFVKVLLDRSSCVGTLQENLGCPLLTGVKSPTTVEFSEG